MSLQIKEFFELKTCTWTYLIWDSFTKDCIVVDPVLDFDPATGMIQDRSFQETYTFAVESQLQILGILETHVHADHLSGSKLWKNKFPKAWVGISDRIREVQKTFSDIFEVPLEKTLNRGDFDLFLKDGQTLQYGSLKFKCHATPGHTPACMSFLFDSYLLTGDTLFMPDIGTGRCDFPGGNAKTLYHSITQKIYSLPDETKILCGHDYPNQRSPLFLSTVAEQKKTNIHIQATTKEESFIEFREKRDQTLSPPKLIWPSLWVNMSAGNYLNPNKIGVTLFPQPIQTL